MNLSAAIDKYNEASQSKIVLLTTRDGRVTAKLPLVGREIIVQGSPFNTDVKVTPADLAWLCEEARRASAPGAALLETALDALAHSREVPASS